MSSIRKRVGRGLVAGLAATVLMSAQMLAPASIDRIGTPPPKRIADTLLPDYSKRDRGLFAALLHLAIGGVGGITYRGLVRRRRGGILSGVMFGIGIWVVGYELVVPALGVLPRADHDLPARRTALLEAHLVYGAALGALS